MTPTAANRQDLHTAFAAIGTRPGNSHSPGRVPQTKGCVMGLWRSVAVFFFFLLLFLPMGRADAWVAMHQEFPHGEATVVVHAFCHDTGTFEIAGYHERRCDMLSQQSWQARITHALAQWNKAGANFQFHTRLALPDDDPCDPEPGHLYVLLTDFTAPHPCHPDQGTLRPGFAWSLYAASGHGWAWVMLNLAALPDLPDQEAKHTIQAHAQDSFLHELGHAVGLGHPDPRSTLSAVGSSYDRGTYYEFLYQDDIDGIRALYGTRPDAVDREPIPHVTGVLENPTPGWAAVGSAPNSYQSGIGVISGWVCDADEVWVSIASYVTWREGRTRNDVVFSRRGYPAQYGAARRDTLSVCGDINNGFGMVLNWNLLDPGTYPPPFSLSSAATIERVSHILTVYADGVEIDDASVQVTTLGQEFVRGATRQYLVTDFPRPGRSVLLEWSESLQNFVIVNRASSVN